MPARAITRAKPGVIPHGPSPTVASRGIMPYGQAVRSSMISPPRPRTCRTVDHAGCREAQTDARFLDLAAHYGFTPRACRPYRAQTTGKDERLVRYIKQHFFVR